MARQQGRVWKMERASVTITEGKRPRSNKYAGSDSTKEPASGERQRVWVGGYVRADGKKVEGYYRSVPGN